MEEVTVGSKEAPIKNRLEAIRNILIGSFDGGSVMSNSTKGNERELFARAFLGQVFPPNFRFASGDITDTHRQCSGQVDIVVEFPSSISFPMYPEAPRLYLAEGVAVVIEVKSDVESQWEQVKTKAEKVKLIRRKFVRQEMEADGKMLRDAGRRKKDQAMINAGEGMLSNLSWLTNDAPEKIPLIAVGYKGWRDSKKIKEVLVDTKDIDAVFIIETLSFVWKNEDGTPGVSNGFQSMIEVLEYIQRQLNKIPYNRSLAWNYLTSHTS
ncbi:MAG: DUF6602 domain-containing protein [Parcubacteria group bacterium]